jgi:hypothetical protein
VKSFYEYKYKNKLFRFNYYIFNCSFTLIYRYELPDNHELLVWVSYSSLSLLCDVIKLCRLTKTRFLTDLSEQLDKREKDDSVPFLLSVWQAGTLLIRWDIILKDRSMNPSSSTIYLKVEENHGFNSHFLVLFC